MNRVLAIAALAGVAPAFVHGPAHGAERVDGAAFGVDAPTSTKPPVVRLVIDTSGMFEDMREDTARWVREDGIPVLTEAGVVVDDATAELEVHVAVMVEGTIGFAVETSVWKPGADQPEVDRGHRICKACRRSDTLLLVTRELAWVGGWLATHPTPVEPAPPKAQDAEPEHAPAQGEENREAKPVHETPGDSSKTLRNVGLALLVPGGVALGVGIGLVAAGTREIKRVDRQIDERNYRPPGIAVAVSGAVAAAAGVALIVVHAKRARGRGDARAMWSPMIGGATAGILLSRRF
jgi:hypothetical protein